VRFRLVASDIDGTLIRSDGALSVRTKAALNAVVDAGSTFILATGRPPRWVHPIAEMTGHQGLAVCSNGALVIDLTDERVIDQRLHDRANALSAAQAVRSLLPDATFAVDGPSGFGHVPGYTTVFNHGRDVRVAPLEELLDGQLTKIMLRHPDMNAEVLRELITVIGDHATVTFGSMGDDLGPNTLVELMPFGVTKADALSRIAHRYDAGADDVIAFGDMPNDIDMLAWAGHGVAMANAHPLAKDAANEVTESNDDDGVAVVLERELAIVAT
jgi:Cof subfamily protein (haloacid dehalogenase superfamily)